MVQGVAQQQGGPTAGWPNSRVAQQQGGPTAGWPNSRGAQQQGGPTAGGPNSKGGPTAGGPNSRGAQDSKRVVPSRGLWCRGRDATSFPRSRWWLRPSPLGWPAVSTFFLAPPPKCNASLVLRCPLSIAAITAFKNHSGTALPRGPSNRAPTASAKMAGGGRWSA